LHMAQLMPLPLTVSCFSKIQIGFTFLVPTHPGSPGKRAAVKRVCVCHFIPTKWRSYREFYSWPQILWRHFTCVYYTVAGTVGVLSTAVPQCLNAPGEPDVSDWPGLAASGPTAEGWRTDKRHQCGASCWQDQVSVLITRAPVVLLCSVQLLTTGGLL